jgi:hypothetical protein
MNDGVRECRWGFVVSFDVCLPKKALLVGDIIWREKFKKPVEAVEVAL